jgi:preprotein translocase subunit YajC
MKFIIGTLAAFSLFAAAPVAAQAQAGITAGMQITDASGSPVGTVAEVKGDNLVVKTDKHEVMLPKTSFSVSEGKLLFGMTQAQLNAEIEKSLAAANASVAAGATVKGLQGTEIGKIDSVSDSGVVIALSSGKKIQVARDGVRGNADGTVTVGLTAEQIDSAAKASADASPASPSGK